ncbi:MAG: glycosyltransferase family 4 protein [Acidobacteriaceae bacterium]
MRIVFIITGLNTGGAEVMLLKVLERLDKRFSPHVISLSDVGEIGLRIQALGVPVEMLGMRPGAPIPRLFLRLIGRLRAIKPGIVHTWMYHADLLGGLAARCARVPAVGWGIRCSSLDRHKTKVSTRAVIAACARLSGWVPDGILSCSAAAERVHIGKGYVADRWKVVPNGFDISLFRPDETARRSVRVELGVEQDTPLVGLIGRYDPFKNHGGFFAAIKELHDVLPAVHFLLAGRDIDPGNRELAQMIEAAGVHGVTHLLGPRKDIPRLMAALDVFASPSYAEGFPNVLGEAMASGVPSVATDVGDCAYIVGDTGKVVPPGDMSGFAKSLEGLLAMPMSQRARLGEHARARVAEHFEIGKIVRQYEQFYDELLERSVGAQ